MHRWHLPEGNKKQPDWALYRQWASWECWEILAQTLAGLLYVDENEQDEYSKAMHPQLSSTCNDDYIYM